MTTKNVIVANGIAHGVWRQCYISGTPKPGTVMQIKAATEPRGGLFTYEVYNPGSDGAVSGAVAVLDFDGLQGRLASTAYADGELGKVYIPQNGEELNMLVANIAGTADLFAIGDALIIDNGTGKLIATTGSPARTPFKCKETVAAITVDTLILCEFTGN